VEIDAVPAPLRAQLGPDATAGLLELLDLSHREARETLIRASSERFERRLVEESSKLRVDMARFESTLKQDMAHLESSLRQEMVTMAAGLRQEMSAMGATLRQEMVGMGATLRQEMAAMRSGLSQEIATGRVELFKWCFIFWIGQVFAMTAILGVMLRLFRP
jgi:hypothetical protein